MSPPPPPQPRATADLIPWRWRVTLAAMDGGAFVVSVGGKDIGKARRIVDAPTRRLTNAKLLPPPSPYYFLIVVCHQLRPLAGGLVTPITIDAPLASR